MIKYYRSLKGSRPKLGWRRSPGPYPRYPLLSVLKAVLFLENVCNFAHLANNMFLSIKINENREVLVSTSIWRIYFHPAKFDNFKDEKMSDYKTVSVAQSKNLLNWKPASLTNHDWATFECSASISVELMAIDIVHGLNPINSTEIVALSFWGWLFMFLGALSF